VRQDAAVGETVDTPHGCQVEPIMNPGSAARVARLLCLALGVALVALLLPAGAQEHRPLPPVPFLEDGKWGLVDRAGKTVAAPTHDRIARFSDGLAAVRNEDRWGYVDDRGRPVVKPVFEEVLLFSEDRGAVRTDGKWGYVDRTGRLVGPERFEAVGPFSGGLAAVRTGRRWGFVDRDLKPVIPPRFERAWDFTEGLAPVRVENRWGFVDRTGTLVIPARYYWVDNFSEGLAYVEGGPGRTGYIDGSGKLVIRRRFWGHNPFTNGLAGVQPEVCGRWGLIDRDGKTRVPPRFHRIGLFSDGLAPVRIQYEWGYIDPSGKLVIPARFRAAASFSNGVARVRLGGKVGYIDPRGRFVSGPYEIPRARSTGPVAPATSPAPGVAPREARIVGPESVPAKHVSRLGNPYRERYPDSSPDVFSRNIRDMILYKDRIYVGAGDYWKNTGPVEIRSFAPGKRTFRREFIAPDEMVSRFYVFEKRLVAPGNDPRESWAFGNLYLKKAGRWRKVRTIPHGLHCFRLAYVNAHLYAHVSTENGTKIVETGNWGKSWRPVPAPGIPSVIFPYRETLCGLDREATFYVLEDGVLTARPMVPRRRRLLPVNPAGAPATAFYREAVRFKKGVLLLPPFSSLRPESPPRGLAYLEEPEETPRPIPLFGGRSIADVVSRGRVLYLLCTRPSADGYTNTIYSTDDVTTWRAVVTFETRAFARSFEEARGRFYVSLGCNGPAGKNLPAETGDILSVIPVRSPQ